MKFYLSDWTFSMKLGRNKEHPVKAIDVLVTGDDLSLLKSDPHYIKRAMKYLPDAQSNKLICNLNGLPIVKDIKITREIKGY